MVEFWGIFVVFSACAAFQMTESRVHNAHKPRNNLNRSTVRTESISNSIDSEEVRLLSSNIPRNSLEDNLSASSEQTEANLLKKVENSSEENEISSTTKSITVKKRLSLVQRRQELFKFARDGMRIFEQDFVRLTREVIEEIVVALEALTKKSENVKAKISEIKSALKDLEGIDLDEETPDFEALEEASEIVDDLNADFNSPFEVAPELLEVLEKVGWLDMRYKLGEEVFTFFKEFGIQLNKFVNTLTPRERQREAGLVDLNRRFSTGSTDAIWAAFTEFWAYFDA
ncbi:uncharacterized protein LOC101455591 [Ceratitis capitata]|uniref:Uncharacterized protein n=1 Tax=Ceratitis capitata TaxID=7213 RepID=W8C870_CERCA|nr:uncharacterized protein LOC101455591 [Ceratitis capitata]